MTKVLIVEDDTFLSQLLTRKLSGSGLEVYSAKDGETGLTMASTLTPSIILLDLILPKKTGFEVMEAIHLDPLLKHIPIIVFSSLTDDVSVKRAHELGAQAYIVKSNVTLDELITKMNQVLSGITGTNSFFKNLST